MAYCADKGIPHSQFLEWDDVDRAKLMAHMLEEAARCKMCGTSNWEWEENKMAYVAVVNHCHGCYVRDAARDAAQQTPGSTIDLKPYSSELIDAQRKAEQSARKARMEARENKRQIRGEPSEPARG